MAARFLTALPVYNEIRYVDQVINQVLQFSPKVLVVDDGSTDGTSELLARRDDIQVVHHPKNRGYGAALQTAFDHAIQAEYEVLVTIDCDGQHEPQRIPEFVAASRQADLVSGSRYLQTFAGDTPPPADRQAINQELTQILNQRLGLALTDAFCGFKAYRTSALRRLQISEPGYAMPLEVWVQAAQLKLRIEELAVPLVYLDLERSFGGALDNADTRLAHYQAVLERCLARLPRSKPAVVCCDGNVTPC